MPLPRGENDSGPDWQLQGQMFLSPLKKKLFLKLEAFQRNEEEAWPDQAGVLVKVQFSPIDWGCRTVNERLDTHLEKQRRGQKKTWRTLETWWGWKCIPEPPLFFASIPGVKSVLSFHHYPHPSSATSSLLARVEISSPSQSNS